LNEHEALQVAISESLSLYQNSMEEEELAMAIQMSLIEEGSNLPVNDSDSGTPIRDLI